MGQIVIIPLIGGIDARRTEVILGSLGARIKEYQPKVALLDISGVPDIDDEGRGYLDKIIQAMQWQGVQTIVSALSEK
jgi:rsbT co-antagonist protein RsbR